MSDLISIVTPCYNGEKYIERYFNSLINQTYKNYEIIFVDDGSTDCTKRIALKYKKIFEKNSINFNYIYQKNGGQAAALNNGLKYVNGNYLVWPDSDDYYENDALEKLLCFLKNNEDYSIVRCKANIRNENNLNKVIGYLEPHGKNKTKETLFEDCIMQNDFYFAPGCYMINMKYMKVVNPTFEIYYNTRGGQNWQMLLPILYNNKCGFVDECLYNYIVRDSSHSHSVKSFEDTLKRYDVHKDILDNTIKRINCENKEYYYDIIEKKYIRYKFELCLEMKNKVNLLKYKNQLRQLGLLTFRDRLRIIKKIYLGW